MVESKLLFEIVDFDSGKTYRIYTNGLITGFEDSKHIGINNRFLQCAVDFMEASKAAESAA